MLCLKIVGFAAAAIAAAVATQGVANAQLAPLCPIGSRQVQLLYPYLDNFTSGADTTLTISNTTEAESGVCTINFIGSPNSSFTPAPINAGSTYTNSVSALNPGFQGYAITICCFGSAVGVEYGHTSTASFSYPAQVSIPLIPLTSSGGSGLGCSPLDPRGC